MKSTNKFALSTSLILMLLCFNAHAKVFRNAYISFEMPETWKCNLEQTEWICRSEQNKEAKEAIIILTAKEVGPTDTIPLYENHLNSPITANIRGSSQTSKIVYKSKSIIINDQSWLDALHMNSEIPNYFTRYLATIKDNIAILVTFSAHKDFYTKYSQDFFKSVMSLRVIATKNIGAKTDIGPIRPGTETLGSPIGSSMPAEMYQPMDTPKKSNSKKIPLAIALVLGAVGILIFLRSKKKK